MSARAHVADCEDVSRVSCPDGDTCDANTVGHYQRYSHVELARLRARGGATALEDAQAMTSTPHTPQTPPDSINLLTEVQSRPGKRTTQISPIKPPDHLDLSRAHEQASHPVTSQPKPYSYPVKAFRRSKSGNSSSETCPECGNKYQSRELLSNHLCVPKTAVTPAHNDHEN